MPTTKAQKEKIEKRKLKLKERERKNLIQEKLIKAMEVLPEKPTIAEYLAYKHKRLYI
jgi:hypothetical protein